MSKVDTKDGSGKTDAMAATIDSGSRPLASAATVASGARDLADSGADTVLGGNSDLLKKSDVVGDEPTPPGPPTEDDLIGVTLNERYEVTAKLGQGGMGAVYEAKHTLIGKRVAVKVLLDKHAEKDQIVARLKQEARLASSIGHDNIVDITDFGTTIAGRTFVVMEYLEGQSLGALISKQGRLEGDRAVAICAQIASALAAAHDKGIVHRDIKPENIFLVTRGDKDFVKVVDFGISKSMEGEDEDVRLTQTGMVLGTPLYMSPEQARGDDDLDHRIDIYALGVILYESVTGKVPFQGKNYLNILTQVISEEPTIPSEIVPEVDRDIESVILKAMAKDRDQRYQTMDEIAADLDALADPNLVTTGARITAARWRKNRDRRSKSAYAVWALSLGGVAGISTLAAFLLMGSSDEAKKKEAPAPVAAISMDAAPVIEYDAAPKAPAFTTIQLVSDPEGAKVYHGSRMVCGPTPCDYKAPLNVERLKLTARLDGYDVGELTITPAVDGGEPAYFTLTKTKTTKKPKQNRDRKNNGQDGSGKVRKNNGSGTDSTGDVMGNPHRRPSE
jgi:serine/threonine protein kinase